MSKINKIRLSGTDYDIQDVSATSVVELTQQQYDDLPASAKTDNILYIITDSTVDYVTSAQTQSAINQAVSGKQDTLVSSVNIKTINNESILGSGNIDIQGGGKAIEAGRGIAITTGETADTVSFNLPISAGTGTNSVAEGENTYANGYASHAEGYDTIASGKYSHAEGSETIASGWGTHAEGNSTSATSQYSHAEGGSTKASGAYSHAEGYNTTASGNYSHTEGNHTKTTNESEHASGKYNVSSSASTTFGDSGNTLFSVGNGTGNKARHNAFEIRQNGDIYLTKDGQDVKLQDQLGGGNSVVELTQAAYDALVTGGTVDPDTFYIITDAQAGDLTNYYTKTETDNAITAATSTKQDQLVSGTNIKTINNESILGSGNIYIQGGSSYTAGDGIDITNNVISVTGKVDTSAITTSVTSSSTDVQVPSAKAVYDQLGGLKLVKLSQSEYDSLSTYDSNTLYVING